MKLKEIITQNYDISKLKNKCVKIFKESPFYDKDVDIKSEYLDNKIINKIENNKNIIKKLDEYIYSVAVDIYSQIYFYAKDNNLSKLIVAVSGEIPYKYIDDKKVFKVYDLKKYDNTVSNAILVLYKWISRNTKTKYIVSGNAHSTSSMIMWRKWLINPKKYGISEIYIYDIEDNKRIKNIENLDDYWGKDNFHIKHRIIVKF